MKKFKLFLTVLLIISTLIMMLVSCKEKNDGTPSVSTPAEESDMTNITGYKIVRKDKANDTLKKMVSNFKKSILDATKADLEVTTDFIKGGEAPDENTDKNAKEILVGETNRSTSISALNKLSEKKYENGFIIEVVENKIIILGTSDNDTVLGLKYFINNYVITSKNENTLLVKVGDTFDKENGKILYTSANLDMVVLEKYSTVIDPGKKSQAHFTYPKIIKLENQPDEKNNGILLATNEQRTTNASDSQYRYPIYKSTDDGDNWERIAFVADEVNKNLTVGYQPYLLELPEDMGEFKKGTIFMSGCSYTSNKTAMVLYYSTDIGATWTTWGNVATGGGYSADNSQLASSGVWEPILMYDDDTNRLYCMYSDELDDEHSQRLVYKYTTDMKNWSDTYEMVACSNKMLRPGMIAITKMGNGKYALIFEMVGMNGNPVYIKICDALDNWGDVSDYGKPVASGSKSLGSSPVIAWTPDGGECGTLFMTGSHMASGGDGVNRCEMFMSFDYGKTFVTMANPIHNMVNPQVHSGYSPGMYVDKDGYLYYVNDPERDKGAFAEKLDFVKIKVY